MFLDYDPALFTRLLNWLRSQDLGGPQGPLGEVTVEAGQEEQVRVWVSRGAWVKMGAVAMEAGQEHVG